MKESSDHRADNNYLLKADERAKQEFLNFVYERCHQGMIVLKSFYM